MDNRKILALTGGLPPSAFSLDYNIEDLLEWGFEEPPAPLCGETTSSALGTDTFCSKPEDHALNETSTEDAKQDNGALCSRFKEQSSLIPTSTSSVTGMPLDEETMSKGGGHAHSRPKAGRGLSVKKRFRPSTTVRKLLEAHFTLEANPNTRETSSIACKAKMTVKQVRTWFRNKRRRTRPEGM
jgi:hypothetical protein